MKKTIQMRIASSLFTFEEDAAAALQNYLESLQLLFAQEKEQTDILADIEIRIAELFLEEQSEVYTLAQVQEVLTHMGSVEEVAEQTNSVPQAEPQMTKKKLYRDTDDVIIAGVCSGLALYLNIDPIWVRIAFLTLFFISGIGFWLYIAMWLLVPLATTVSQKLEMMGNNITLAQIKAFRERGERKPHTKVEELLSFPREFFQKVILPFFPVFTVVGGFILLSTAVLSFLLLTTLGILFWLSPSRLTDIPFQDFLSISLQAMAYVSVYVVIAIPISIFGVIGYRLFRQKKIIGSGILKKLVIFGIIALAATGVCLVSVYIPYSSFAQTDSAYEFIDIQIPLSSSAINELYTLTDIPVDVRYGEQLSLQYTGRRKELNRVNITNTGTILTLETHEYTTRCLLCDKENAQFTLFTPHSSSIIIHKKDFSQVWQDNK